MVNWSDFTICPSIKMIQGSVEHSRGHARMLCSRRSSWCCRHSRCLSRWIASRATLPEHRSIWRFRSSSPLACDSLGFRTTSAADGLSWAAHLRSPRTTPNALLRLCHAPSAGRRGSRPPNEGLITHTSSQVSRVCQSHGVECPDHAFEPPCDGRQIHGDDLCLAYAS